MTNKPDAWERKRRERIELLKRQALATPSTCPEPKMPRPR